MVMVSPVWIRLASAAGAVAWGSGVSAQPAIRPASARPKSGANRWAVFERTDLLETAWGIVGFPSDPASELFLEGHHDDVVNEGARGVRIELLVRVVDADGQPVLDLVIGADLGRENIV